MHRVGTSPACCFILLISNLILSERARFIDGFLVSENIF